ncbi:hypothetical protein TNCV_3031961 [Trichonephila clavipes]|nr:hypothetical protein TNCV_3031961 [Trichonephila clavipes]
MHLKSHRAQKQNLKNRRKRTLVQKPEIEIKMAPHKPSKSAPTEYAAEEEDMTIYAMEENEFEPISADKYVMMEYK